MLKKSLLAAAVASFLAGCSSLKPMEFDEKLPTTESKTAESVRMSEAWNSTAVLSEGRSAVVLLTPESIPETVKNKKVSLEMEPGATVQDIVAVLGKLGISVIIADSAAAKKDLYIPRYVGTIGGLLSAVTKATDVWFTWHEGSISVSSSEKIGVSVPQEKSFGEELGKGLEGLGIKEKTVHWQSGMAVVSLSPSQFRKTKTFLERYTANAAIVTLQVAIVNVTLNQTAKQGIDWEQLQVSALSGGDAARLKAVRDAYNLTGANSNGALASNTLNGLNSGGVPGTGTNTGTSTNTGTGTGTGTNTGTGTGTGTNTGTGGSTAANIAAGAIGAVSWAGGSLTGAIFTGRFSFQGLFGYLQNYGVAETKQNVMLKTITGNKVEFKSLTQIPYVSEIGAVTSGVAGNGNVTGSTQTAKADDGITVALNPTYDSAANSVTIDLNLSIKAVVAFNELSAGNQLGKLTQPTTAERSFTDTLRVRPGQTVVVGGLTYDSVSDNRAAPVALTGTNLEFQSLKVQRQTMFIVVRPTVMKLGQVLSQESGESLDIFPEGKSVSGIVATDDASTENPRNKSKKLKNSEVPPIGQSGNSRGGLVKEGGV